MRKIRQNRPSSRTFFLVILTIMVLISIILMWRVSKLEQNQEFLESEVKYLREQVSEIRVDLINCSSGQGSTDPEPVETTVHEPDISGFVTQEELEIMAKVLYREARGVPDKAQQAAVYWCILNRVDNGSWGDTIKEVATYPEQFAWVPDTPIVPEFIDLAIDVCERWVLEKQGVVDVGRTLPRTYIFFTGDGEANHYREEYQGGDNWDWGLPSPY